MNSIIIYMSIYIYTFIKYFIRSCMFYVSVYLVLALKTLHRATPLCVKPTTDQSVESVLNQQQESVLHDVNKMWTN